MRDKQHRHTQTAHPHSERQPTRALKNAGPPLIHHGCKQKSQANIKSATESCISKYRRNNGERLPVKESRPIEQRKQPTPTKSIGPMQVRKSHVDSGGTARRSSSVMCRTVTCLEIDTHTTTALLSQHAHDLMHIQVPGGVTTHRDTAYQSSDTEAETKGDKEHRSKKPQLMATCLDSPDKLLPCRSASLPAIEKTGGDLPYEGDDGSLVAFLTRSASFPHFNNTRPLQAFCNDPSIDSVLFGSEESGCRRGEGQSGSPNGDANKERLEFLVTKLFARAKMRSSIRSEAAAVKGERSVSPCASPFSSFPSLANPGHLQNDERWATVSAPAVKAERTSKMRRIAVEEKHVRTEVRDKGIQTEEPLRIGVSKSTGLPSSEKLAYQDQGRLSRDFCGGTRRTNASASVCRKSLCVSRLATNILREMWNQTHGILEAETWTEREYHDEAQKDGGDVATVTTAATQLSALGKARPKICTVLRTLACWPFTTEVADTLACRSVEEGRKGQHHESRNTERKSRGRDNALTSARRRALATCSRSRRCQRNVDDNGNELKRPEASWEAFGIGPTGCESVSSGLKAGAPARTWTTEEGDWLDSRLYSISLRGPDTNPLTSRRRHIETVSFPSRLVSDQENGDGKRKLSDEGGGGDTDGTGNRRELLGDTGREPATKGGQIRIPIKTEDHRRATQLGAVQKSQPERPIPSERHTARRNNNGESEAAGQRKSRRGENSAEKLSQTLQRRTSEHAQTGRPGCEVRPSIGQVGNRFSASDSSSRPSSSINRQRRLPSFSFMYCSARGHWVSPQPPVRPSQNAKRGSEHPAGTGVQRVAGLVPTISCEEHQLKLIPDTPCSGPSSLCYATEQANMSAALNALYPACSPALVSLASTNSPEIAARACPVPQIPGPLHSAFIHEGEQMCRRTPEGGLAPNERGISYATDTGEQEAGDAEDLKMLRAFLNAPLQDPGEFLRAPHEKGCPFAFLRMTHANAHTFQAETGTGAPENAENSSRILSAALPSLRTSSIEDHNPETRSTSSGGRTVASSTEGLRNLLDLWIEEGERLRREDAAAVRCFASSGRTGAPAAAELVSVGQACGKEEACGSSDSGPNEVATQAAGGSNLEGATRLPLVWPSSGVQESDADYTAPMQRTTHTPQTNEARAPNASVPAIVTVSVVQLSSFVPMSECERGLQHESRSMKNQGEEPEKFERIFAPPEGSFRSLPSLPPADRKEREITKGVQPQEDEQSAVDEAWEGENIFPSPGGWEAPFTDSSPPSCRGTCMLVRRSGGRFVVAEQALNSGAAAYGSAPGRIPDAIKAAKKKESEMKQSLARVAAKTEILLDRFERLERQRKVLEQLGKRERRRYRTAASQDLHESFFHEDFQLGSQFSVRQRGEGHEETTSFGEQTEWRRETKDSRRREFHRRVIGFFFRLLPRSVCR
ncbi:hypothetical protein BESB_049550 [Besnoitia besnoiti]|uniref:Uncharacterized protein n=1 Tax=Besnoitia besnoiti TaxID=94643 RepID=A0A2A9MLY7_BESBE|nr:hypothetical protein BESB_049550 [Besnoitia besnoiti]PFH36763.1 hypothetical protein BESB_049550 [Besnoitia besnoiti]